METTDRENAEIVKEAEKLVEWGLQSQNFITAIYFERMAEQAVGHPEEEASLRLAVKILVDKAGGGIPSTWRCPSGRSAWLRPKPLKGLGPAGGGR